VLDSLIAAGNSFQMVGAEKVKEHLLKIVVQEGIHKRNDKNFTIIANYIQSTYSNDVSTNPLFGSMTVAPVNSSPTSTLYTGIT